MNWEGSWMDIGLATIIGVLIANIFTDFAGWKKVKNKIGENKSDTLEGQHDNIEKTVISKTESIERFQNNEFSRIYAKVDSIDKEIYANKEKYQNLNLDQKEIKNNLDKLLFEWQNLVTENKELKKETEILREQNNELFQQNIKEHENNLKLAEKLEIANQILGINDKSKAHNENLFHENEDDWELER